MADGWAVVVEMPTDGGNTSKQTWHAHIPDRAAAELAVRERVHASSHTKVEAKEQVSHSSFVGMKIAEGAVGQWWGTIP